MTGFSRHSFSYLIDRFIASDPGLVHFHMGARALLTAALAAGVTTLLTRWLQLSATLGMIGVIVPMMTSVAIQDPTRKQQMVTTALIPVVASAAALIGSGASSNIWLSSGLFLAVIFAAFEARRFGPRGSALGTVAYLTYFVTMFLHPPFAKAEWLVFFIFIGCAIAFAVRFWLVTERPERTLNSQLKAYKASIAALLHELAVYAASSNKKAGRRKVRARLSALNDISLQIESHLAAHPDSEDPQAEGPFAEDDNLRSRVLRCELAAETLSATVRSIEESLATSRPSAAGSHLSSLLESLRTTIRRAAPFDAAAFARAEDDAGLPLSAEMRWRFCWAAKTLANESAWEPHRSAKGRQHSDAPHADSKAQAEPERKQAQGNTGKKEARQGFSLDDNTRQAIKATAAALGAMAVGRAISSDRWYWAVIAAFVVFTRAMTVGQTLSRAWQRVLGTVAGVAFGLLIAEAVHGRQQLELVLLFAFVGLGYYLFRASQAIYVLLLTTMLALLYELIGRYSPGVLYLRLEETLAGAACAVLSAAVILPVRTSSVADAKSAELLSEASGLLRSMFDGGDAPAPHDAVRDLDRKLQALRQSLGPVTGTTYPAPKAGRRRLLHRLSILVYSVRHLYTFTDDHPPDAHQRQTYHDAAKAIAANMDALAAVLKRSAPADDAGKDQMQQAFPQQPLADKMKHGASETERVTTGWLWQSNEVVRAMYNDLVSAGKPAG